MYGDMHFGQSYVVLSWADIFWPSELPPTEFQYWWSWSRAEPSPRPLRRGGHSIHVTAPRTAR